MAHSLLVYDPGHFHAALLLCKHTNRVAPTIHVYAQPGPDVEKFVALIEGFNQRESDPTHWQLECHLGDRALETMIAERRGDSVILAGRNGLRLALMHQLHDAGFNIIADKPWLTDSAALPHLNAITAGPPVVADVMAGRHNPNAQLRNLVIATSEVFGSLGCESKPALEFTSRHHLLKLVAGQPLQRPPWFYDSTVQGDGMVDIQSHYVDQAQWITGNGYRFDIDRDVEILDAERWTTPVPLALFQESTGEPQFPDYLADVVNGDTLQLACNGHIDYRIRGVWVRQYCDWGLREPEGGGDIQSFTARGDKAVLTVELGPDTNFKPEIRLSMADGRELTQMPDEWRERFPTLEMTGSNGEYRLHLPPTEQSGHDGQFPPMLDQFLDLVEAENWPAELAARIRTRYTLLARARDHALAKGNGIESA